MTTLLIDDEREMLVDRIARNYSDGVAALAEKVWDMLLLDCNIGVPSGLDILIWLNMNQQYRPKAIKFVTSTEYVLAVMGEYCEMMGYEKKTEREWVLK